MISLLTHNLRLKARESVVKEFTLILMHIWGWPTVMWLSYKIWIYKIILFWNLRMIISLSPKSSKLLVSSIPRISTLIGEGNSLNMIGFKFLDCKIPNMFPIHTFEERRAFDFFKTRFMTHSLFSLTTKTFNCSFGFNRYRDFRRKDKSLLPIADFSVGFLWSFLKMFCKFYLILKTDWAKWRIANEHFIHNDSQRPPITTFSITILLEKFWCLKN